MRCRSTRVVSRLVDALAAIDRWGAPRAAAGVVRAGEIVATHGSLDERFRWASITKLLTAGAILVAAEEGVLDLDEPAGPPGSTVRHLLAHASGLPFEGPEPIARPGARRIYSNTGYELLGALLAERSGMPFDHYLAGAVLGPVGIESVRLEGTPAAGAVGSLAALLSLARELLAPRFVAAETLAEATEVAFPGWSASCRASGARILATGASASSFATPSRPTGPGRERRRRRSAISAEPVRSCGSTRRWASRSDA